MITEEEFMDVWDSLDDADKVQAWNEYCDRISNPGDEIYDWGTVEDIISTMTPMDAFNTGRNSDINFTEDYYRFDGYGNLESTYEPNDWMYPSDMYNNDSYDYELSEYFED